MKKKAPTTALALPPEISPTYFAELTPKEQAFVLHPLVMTDVQKAYVEAGYAAHSSTSEAWRKRKQLMYYIRAITNKRAEEEGISLQRVEKELGSIAFANEVDFFEKIDTENDTILVAKDPKLLPVEMQRAIKSIDTSITLLTNGVSIPVVSFTLHDKVPALKMLVEMLGGFDPRSREPGDAETRRKQAELFDFMSADELKTITEIYARAEARRAKELKGKIADKEAINGEAKTV